MPILTQILTRIRRTGFIVLAGLLLVLYAGLGILYLQQPQKQQRFEEQTAQLFSVATRPLPNIVKLREEYSEVNRALAPMAIPAYLDILVGIANKSGINIDKDADKFYIPTAGKPVEVKVGGGKYQVLPFKGIRVQGEYDKVMAFIADLDSGKTLKTMVLKKAEIEDVQVWYKGEEEIRRKEFNSVRSAVAALMAENKLSSVPNPKSYAGGKGSYDMTTFPDSTSGWAESAGGKIEDPKGKPYVDGDKGGYVLYRHDFKADGKKIDLVDYIIVATTRYYYTCETDGKVRQFSEPDLKTAAEFMDSGEYEIETLATVDVDFYSRLPELPKPKESPTPTPAPAVPKGK